MGKMTKSFCPWQGDRLILVLATQHISAPQHPPGEAKTDSTAEGQEQASAG